MTKTTFNAAVAIALAALVSAHAVADVDDNAAVFTTQLPEAGSTIARGQAILVVDKPLAQVLPVVRDYANYAAFMPNFKKSSVLAERGSRAMVYVEVSVARGAFTLWGQLSLAERPVEREVHVVEARLMEGNVDAFNASFTLTPVDGGARTEVDFKIYVDPDIPLPSSVFSRENEKAAGRAVRALRARVFEGAQGPT